MIPTPSSSSSTLSPLAPPFTVDRPTSAHCLQPYCYPPSPSVCEFNGRASLDAKESSSVKSTGESSSWMDPSMPYNTSPFSRGGATESFIAYGAWHGKHVDSSARQVHIGADSSAWRDEHATIYEEKAKDSCNNGLSYFQLPNPNLAMDECNASNRNSYDRYISQLVSCSTDPIVYYPATTCSSSDEEFNPANETTRMYFPSRNCYSTAQHGNLLYNVDDNYVDYMLHNKKETTVDQYSDGKGGYAMESKADSNMKGNIGEGNFSVATGCSSLGNDVTTRYSMDYSTEVKHGLGTKQLNFPESIASSSKPNSSLWISSELLDQPNLAVDSPCWKGASMSQQYSFGGGEMIDPQVKESKGSDDFDQGQKYLPVSGQYLRNSPFQEKGGNLVFHGSSLPSGNFSPNISSYGTDKRFHGVNAEGSECAEIGVEKRSHFSCAICEKSIEAKASEKNSEVGNRNEKQLGPVRTVVLSVNSPALVGEGVHAETGLVDAKSSKLNPDTENLVRNFSVPGAVLGQFAKPIDSTVGTGKDMRLLVKAIHGLSEVLLSSSCNGAVGWKECDHELIQQVIGNLETFTSRNKKGIPEYSSHAPGNERGGSQISISKSNDTDKNRCNTDTEGKFQCIGSCINNDKADVRRFKTQVSVKDLESDLFAKKEGNPQAELYKNLWMQAEAAVCSIKYELQLTRMKLEMEDNEFQTKAKESVQLMRTARLNSMQCSDTPVCTAPQSFCNDSSCLLENVEGKSIEVKPMEHKTKKDDKVESSVMARLEVLNGRYARSNNICIEEQTKCCDAENTLNDLPTRLADLGFLESTTPQPFDDGNRDGFPSLLKGNPADVQNLVPIHSRENYVLHSEIPGNTVGGALLGCSADGPFPQPFLPSMDCQTNPMRLILG